MLLLPYENITYKSELSAEEALQKLTSAVDADPPFWGWSKKPYRGEIDNNNFEIRRITKGRGADVTLPRIFGIVESKNGGSEIKVIMRLPYLHMAIVLAILLITLFTDDPIALSRKNLNQILAGPVMLTFIIYVILMVLFKMETRSAKEDLRQIFEAAIVAER